MKVQVDQSKCQGHNRCYAIAPELFDVDDLGNAFAIGDGVVEPYVAAGIEDRRHRDVVVGQEDDAVADLRIIREANELLDEALATITKPKKVIRAVSPKSR